MTTKTTGNLYFQQYVRMIHNDWKVKENSEVRNKTYTCFFLLFGLVSVGGHENPDPAKMTLRVFR
jgi:hypothetical protein